MFATPCFWQWQIDEWLNLNFPALFTTSRQRNIRRTWHKRRCNFCVRRGNFRNGKVGIVVGCLVYCDWYACFCAIMFRWFRCSEILPRVLRGDHSFSGRDFRLVFADWSRLYGINTAAIRGDGVGRICSKHLGRLWQHGWRISTDETIEILNNVTDFDLNLFFWFHKRTGVSG